LDGDTPGDDAAGHGDHRLHGGDVRRDFRRLAHDGEVEIDNPAPALANEARGMLEEDPGSGVLPAWVGGRKEGADIAFAEGAVDRIGERMERGVGVGMALE